MCRKHLRPGFTLIEVMVVLSILALVAVLGYGYFGSVMKEAKEVNLATRLHRDLSILATGILDYELKTGAEPASNNMVELVSGGYIRVRPGLPTEALISNPWNEYRWNSTTDVIFAHAVNDAICKRYNEKFAPSIGYAIYQLPAPYTAMPAEMTWCAYYVGGSTAGWNYVMMRK